MQKKIASKISAGVLSALLVLQGMFPTVSVMADEISETKPSETVIEETVTESSEETKASEETTVPETSEQRLRRRLPRQRKLLLLKKRRCLRHQRPVSQKLPKRPKQQKLLLLQSRQRPDQRSTSLMLLIQKLSVTSFQTCHLLTALSFRQHLI